MNRNPQRKAKAAPRTDLPGQGGERLWVAAAWSGAKHHSLAKAKRPGSTRRDGSPSHCLATAMPRDTTNRHGTSAHSPAERGSGDATPRKAMPSIGYAETRSAMVAHGSVPLRWGWAGLCSAIQGIGQRKAPQRSSAHRLSAVPLHGALATLSIVSRCEGVALTSRAVAKPSTAKRSFGYAETRRAMAEHVPAHLANAQQRHSSAKPCEGSPRTARRWRGESQFCPGTAQPRLALPRWAVAWPVPTTRSDGVATPILDQHSKGGAQRDNAVARFRTAGRRQSGSSLRDGTARQYGAKQRPVIATPVTAPLSTATATLRESPPCKGRVRLSLARPRRRHVKASRNLAPAWPLEANQCDAEALSCCARPSQSEHCQGEAGPSESVPSDGKARQVTPCQCEGRAGRGPDGKARALHLTSKQVQAWRWPGWVAHYGPTQRRSRATPHG
jgi:hypothetical protein